MKNNQEINRVVTFVSLGPGDPELMTLKALKLLQKVDIIFCPSTKAKTGKTLSRGANILSFLDIDRDKIHFFDVPMSKNREKTIKSYHNVSVEIQKLYQQQKDIAVVAEGHNGFYSSSYYISEFLTEQHIPNVQIAGIPAFIACGTLANMHIVKQDEKLVVLPHLDNIDELSSYIERNYQVVLMKTSKSAEIIKQYLRENPKTDIHYFENVGSQKKEFYTTNISEILDREFPYFSLIIIKNVR